MKSALVLAALLALCTACQRHSSGQASPIAARARHAAAPSFSPVLGQPTPDSDSILRVNKDVSEPVELVRVKPVWPKEQVPHKFSSPIFIFEAIIDEHGSVQNLKVVSEPRCMPRWPELTAAAREAILQWRYKPATYKGKPVAVYLTVTVSVHLL